MKTTVFGHVKFCVDQSERVHLALSRTKDKEVTLFPIHPTIDVRKASFSSVTWTHEGYINVLSSVLVVLQPKAIRVEIHMTPLDLNCPPRALNCFMKNLESILITPST